ncbi:perivitellin-2 67 kDa subunit [Elysia marginata]|uniref:Perivitellin-2 67 kDa subunit n=1 Tax=Elysia marginata TaxID=1093978 RepID=A0AAV4HJA1_9GAST|nr:perivitellin-2 67 kDa subunit [Elysia marginata]
MGLIIEREGEGSDRKREGEEGGEKINGKRKTRAGTRKEIKENGIFRDDRVEKGQAWLIVNVSTSPIAISSARSLNMEKQKSCSRQSLTKICQPTTSCILILLVVLIKAGEVRSEEIECTNPPPGVMKMTRGVDIAELDLMPYSFSVPDGFKSPVVHFTCNEGRVFTKDSKSYTLPDQIWMTEKPGGELNANVHLYKKSADLRSRLSRDVGGAAVIKRFGFGASHSYQELQHTITMSSKYISDVSSYYSSSRVDIKADWQLRVNPQVEQFLETFVGNSTYESNPELYKRFIELYGTHYFSVANFGGHVRSLYETNMNYFFSHTDEQVKNNARLSFMFWASAEGKNEKKLSDSQSQYDSESKQIVRFYGGSANLLSANGLQTWQPTVAANPWLFSGKVKPISDLLHNVTHKNNMEKAIRQHILQAYLAELRRLFHPSFSSNTLTAIERRLADMEALSPGALGEEDLETLGMDINNEITVPSWFLTNTQLCFKWHSRDDGGSCYRRVNRRFCLRAGSTIPLQRKDPDKKRGGCRTHWSFVVTESEPWFSQIKVCFCWHADGDGNQCNASGLLCVPLNKYSQEITSDNADRLSGSKMSWKLSAPDSAPVWFRKITMCFSWYADGSCAECGTSHTKKMCVTPGKWTSYHKPPSFENSGFRFSSSVSIFLLGFIVARSTPIYY